MQPVSGHCVMTIAIDLNSQQEQALVEVAKQLQVTAVDLAAAVRDLVAQRSSDFEVAAQRVLDKNSELYRRLA
jgi:hypothetical protein